MFIYRPLVFENVVATEAPINLLSRWSTADLEQQLGIYSDLFFHSCNLRNILFYGSFFQIQLKR
ncbi:hypothetical protein V6Z11_A09G191500 [Gossypium hirsutum]